MAPAFLAQFFASQAHAAETATDAGAGAATGASATAGAAGSDTAGAAATTAAPSLTDLAMMPTDQSLVGWLVALPIILPLLGAGLTLALRSAPRWQAAMTLAFMAATAFAAVGLSAEVTANGPMIMAMGNWLPPFGIVIVVDQLSALLVLVSSLVGLIGLGYALADVDGPGVRYGFYSFYLLLMAGVNGAFSTGDIFNLYVWFEVFLISSFGLMILGGTRVQLDGAVKYGVLNLIATTIFLIAVGATYGATGTLNIADLTVIFQQDTSAPVATLGALFVLAFAMKAAAFPLHFWLPASYHTPKVIVSALFAGLLTKVGVYSLMRVMVMLFGDKGEAYLPLIAVVGILTAMLGALGALAQTDLKRMAAFLVISGIGVMLIGVGIGTQAALAGAIVYAVHSIFVMTAFFLVLGYAERLSGTGNLLRSGGLYGSHGLAAALFLVFGFAVSGLPPFSGFWPKLMLIDASLQTSGWLAVSATVAIILSGFLTTIVVGRSWALVFLKPADQAPVAGEGGVVARAPDMGLTVVLFAALVVGLGVFPSIVIEPASVGAAGLLDPAAYVRSVLEVN
ncbi:MAG: proton-conducting transporter membrane subunit [Pseudomonadota bacterium]